MPAGPDPGAAGVHRRDLGDHGHGPALRSGAARRAGGGRRAAWPLEDHDVPGRRSATMASPPPACFDGAINGARFLAYVEQALAPTLRAGDIVVLDNLTCTRSRACARPSRQRALRSAHLPPYSPDLNPIEQAFAKLKALLRTAARRTVDALWRAIAHALDAFSPAECAHYFAHAGYAPPNREPL